MSVKMKQEVVKLEKIDKIFAFIYIYRYDEIFRK